MSGQFSVVEAERLALRDAMRLVVSHDEGVLQRRSSCDGAALEEGERELLSLRLRVGRRVLRGLERRAEFPMTPMAIGAMRTGLALLVQRSVAAALRVAGDEPAVRGHFAVVESLRQRLAAVDHWDVEGTA